MQTDQTIPMMPSFDSMTIKKYSTRSWLTYYWNVWKRNASARAIDVMTDRMRKEKDPEEMVSDPGTGQQIPVRIRLELRKMQVEEAMEILTGAEALLALTDEELEKQAFSPEMLKIDEDMMKNPEPVVMKKYRVIHETGVNIGDTTYAKDSVIDADSATPETEAFIKGGFIVEISEAEAAAYAAAKAPEGEQK